MCIGHSRTDFPSANAHNTGFVASPCIDVTESETAADPADGMMDGSLFPTIHHAHHVFRVRVPVHSTVGASAIAPATIRLFALEPQPARVF
jgi:hypothetical protein